MTATLGGPIKKDKAFFFGAYEYINRSLITGNQIISVKPADAAALGHHPAGRRRHSGATRRCRSRSARSTTRSTPSTLVTGRYFYFQNLSLSNIGGGLTTTDRATDFHDKMGSAAIQAVTTIGTSKLNEFRYQFAQRHQFRTIGTGVAGPAITVSGIAQFGGPRIGDDNSVGFDFTQKINQVIDNFTWVRGAHALQERDSTLQFIGDDRVAGRELSVHLRRPSTRTSPRRAARIRSRYTTAAADLRPAGHRLQLALLRLLRAGRLADHAAHQAALRSALRPVRCA